MPSEIRVVVSGFDIGIRIQVRLRREKVKRPAMLCYPRHVFAAKALLFRLRYDQHELTRAAGRAFGRPRTMPNSSTCAINVFIFTA